MMVMSMEALMVAGAGGHASGGIDRADERGGGYQAVEGVEALPAEAVHADVQEQGRLGVEPRW